MGAGLHLEGSAIIENAVAASDAEEIAASVRDEAANQVVVRQAWSPHRIIERCQRDNARKAAALSGRAHGLATLSRLGFH